MKKIFLLSPTILIIILSCCTNKKPAEKPNLVDGWYNLSSDGIKREFSGDTVILTNEPVIAFNDIASIKTELNTYLDTALELTFKLAEKGAKELSQLIHNQDSRQIYFVLDDTLINLHNISINSESNKNSNLRLKLGYSNFSAYEAARIERKIKHRLKN